MPCRHAFSTPISEGIADVPLPPGDCAADLGQCMDAQSWRTQAVRGWRMNTVHARAVVCRVPRDLEEH